MQIEEDRWLSKVVGHPVFRIEVGSQAAGEAIEIGPMIRRHADAQRAAMYYAKVGTGDVETVRRLGSAGLYVVDVNVTYAVTPGVASGAAGGGGAPRYAVETIRPEQHEAVLDIAGNCFRYSRFHLDPLIPASTANRIKREWISSYIRKDRGEALYIASAEGELLGFLAVLASEHGGRLVRVIDLIGVRTEARHQGVGRALVGFFVDRLSPGADELQVGTQVANVTSIRLYERYGFLLLKSAYVMHMHVARGGGV